MDELDRHGRHATIDIDDRLRDAARARVGEQLRHASELMAVRAVQLPSSDIRIAIRNLVVLEVPERLLDGVVGQARRPRSRVPLGNVVGICHRSGRDGRR